MDMQPTRPETPLAFKVALVNLILGISGTIYILLSGSFSSGWLELSMGFILLGLGEYINNPQVNLPENNTEPQSRIAHFFVRKRNVSALGNIFDIAGILGIAAGIASLLQ